MKDETRRRFLTTSAVFGVAATAGCTSRLPVLGGDDTNPADSQRTNLGVEPVVETRSQHAADWRNTSWVAGITLSNTPEESWRVPVEEYEGVQSGGTATGTDAYLFTDDQRIIHVDATTGDETAEHPIGIQNAATPITYNNRVYMMGEIDSSDSSGMVTLLTTDMTERVWSGYTRFTPSTDLTTYLSHSYVGTERGQLFCFNNQDGVSEWVTVIDEDTPVVHAPVVNRDNVYATTSSTLVSLTRDSGSESWSTNLPEEPITNPVLYGSHVLIVGTETIMSYDAETGSEQWRATRQSPDSSVFVTAGNDSINTYRVTGDETTIVQYDIQDDNETTVSTVPGTVSATPIVSNALVYIPQHEGVLAWDMLRDTTEWAYETSDSIIHQPILTSENVLLQTETDLIAIN